MIQHEVLTARYNTIRTFAILYVNSGIPMVVLLTVWEQQTQHNLSNEGKAHGYTYTQQPSRAT